MEYLWWHKYHALDTKHYCGARPVGPDICPPTHFNMAETLQVVQAASDEIVIPTFEFEA